MKKILVPTDFSIQSLNIVHEIVHVYPHEKVSIYLVHMVEIPDDIHDLLFLRRNHLMAHVPQKFLEAMQLLRNKYQSQVVELDLDFYYGNRAAILNSVIENRSIDEICVLSNYHYLKPLKQSVNMVSFIERCKVAVRKLQARGRTTMHSEANQFSSLIIKDVMNVPV